MKFIQQDDLIISNHRHPIQHNFNLLYAILVRRESTGGEENG